jgi:hypothetical protein
MPLVQSGTNRPKLKSQPGLKNSWVLRHNRLQATIGDRVVVMGSMADIHVKN